MVQDIPWHRQEIFHDEYVNYPQPDFFPLTTSNLEEEKILPDPLSAEQKDLK